MHVEATHNQISNQIIDPLTQAFRSRYIVHIEQVPSTLNNNRKRRRMRVANTKAKDFFGHIDFRKELAPLEEVKLS
jgi:hypothetical protein